MPARVELIREAVEDLNRYVAAGNHPLFLKRLLRLEEVGKDADLPLARELTGWRKIVGGDRNWRIIFTTDPDGALATVWVIGDRDDASCYREAQRRVKRMSRSNPHAVSLAATMFQLNQMKRTSRQTKGRKQ